MPNGRVIAETAAAKSTRGRPADLDDELHFIRLVHADAGGIVSGERRKRFGPEAGVRVFMRAHVVGTHAHHLRGEGQAVAG